MKNMTSEDENDVLYAVWAYVMYTFGCSIFADKSGDRVSTAWLEYLEDMGGIHDYAWGAGIPKSVIRNAMISLYYLMYILYLLDL
ncbi:hypothetical protein ACS0TY_035484 [Phlomoides rotata]